MRCVHPDFHDHRWCTTCAVSKDYYLDWCLVSTSIVSFRCRAQWTAIILTREIVSQTLKRRVIRASVVTSKIFQVRRSMNISLPTQRWSISLDGSEVILFALTESSYPLRRSMRSSSSATSCISGENHSPHDPNMVSPSHILLWAFIFICLFAFYALWPQWS